MIGGGIFPVLNECVVQIRQVDDFIPAFFVKHFPTGGKPVTIAISGEAGTTVCAGTWTLSIGRDVVSEGAVSAVADTAEATATIDVSPFRI